MHAIVAIIAALSLGAETSPVTGWNGADPSGACRVPTNGTRIVMTQAGAIFSCVSGSWARQVTVTPTAAAPTFTPTGGSFSSSVSVTVGTSSTGANIYCTTDGTTPTPSSTQYTAPLTFSANTTLSCLAAGGGFYASPVTTATYLFTPTYFATFTGSPCQTTVAGTGISVTNNRTSIAWVTQGGAEYQCAANQSRIGDLGVLSELQAIQYVTNPDAPTTESVSMPTGGAFHGRMTGAGSVALTFGTAAGTGLPCTITASSPCIFTISTAGTVTWTPSGQVSLLNVINWAKGGASIHAAMTRGADGANFTTPAVSNNYCLLTTKFSPWNGTFANLVGATGIIGAGWSGANRTVATISAIGAIVGTFADSSGGTKTVTVNLSAAEMLTSHSLSLCRSAAGAVTMYLDGVRVGNEAGAGTGIASTTPATPTYVGSSGGQNGPLWVADVGFNPSSTAPGITLETRTRVAGLGDSQTYGQGGSTSYPATLQSTLGGNYLVANFGVSGQTTAQILSRYQNNQIQDRRYKVLVVLAGINDIRTDVAVATIESNLQTIYDAHRAQGGQLIIATMLPWHGWTSDYTAGRETNRQTVNTWIRNYASTNSVPLVDFSATFDNGSGYIISGWNADGLHPNDSGYIEMARQVYVAGHTASYW